MVSYLKINRNENYTFRNLRRWFQIFSEMDVEHIFVLCDSEELRNKVKIKIPEYEGDYEWIESNRTDNDLVQIVDTTIVDKWKFAAYAHLTTFLHARNNGFTEFWNIDADDTFFCLSKDRTIELLNEVQSFSKRERITVMSLDMWRSRYVGLHWTFGITYTDNTIDWIGLIRKHISGNPNEMSENMKLCRNVDSLFSYLRDETSYRIESFYFERLRFIHYSDDMLRRWFDSGMIIYRNGKIEFPLITHCLDMDDIGYLDIFPDVIGLDIGITDDESVAALIENGYNRSSSKWIRNIYSNKMAGLDNQEIKDRI